MATSGFGDFIDALDGNVSGGNDPCDTLGPVAIGQYARAAGLPWDRVAVAIAIALAESGGKPCEVNRKNSNGSVDRGLWQINSIHTKFDPERLLSAGYNARAMADISKMGTDWSQWTVFKTGKYLEFMDEAATGDQAAEVSARDGLRAVGENLAPDGWARQALTIVMVAVFVAAGVALLGVGGSKLSGISSNDIVSKAGPAAAAASLV